MIKNLNKFINNTRDIVINSKIYKIYKLYKNSIKLFSIINILLYYNYFQLNLDYLALMAIIYSILEKLTYFIGKEFINYFKKMFFIFTDNLDSANEKQVSNYKEEASSLQLNNSEDKIYLYYYNRFKCLCLYFLGFIYTWCNIHHNKFYL